jgi:hypothetical protein
MINIFRTNRNRILILLVVGSIAVLFFLISQILATKPATRVEPAELEQRIGLELPASAKDVNMSVGGFIDTQVHARFEMSKKDYFTFLNANKLEVNATVPAYTDSERSLRWWRPESLKHARILAPINVTKRTTTAFYFNLLVGDSEGNGDGLTVYLRASDD